MRLAELRTGKVAMVLVALLLGVVPGVGQSRRVPAVRGTLLNGTAVELPGALRGKVGVLVIGFSQGSREQVSGWGKRLSAEYAGVAGVGWFEVAELESVPRLLRGWVTKKVKESVSAKGQETFVVVTEQEKAWKEAVGFGGADDAYVLVLDGAGVVRARVEGALSDAGLAEVKQVVEGLRR